MGRRPAADWLKVRAEYETGHFTPAMLAKRHGVSAGTVCKRASEEGWAIGHTDKIIAERTKGKLLEHEAKKSAEREDAIEIAAEVNARVIREHRRIGERGRDLVMKLLDELEGNCDAVPELEDLIDKTTDVEEAGIGRVRASLMARLSTGSRAGALKDVVTAAKTLVEIERVAFNLDGDKGDDPSRWSDDRLDARITELLRKARAAGAAGGEAGA